MKSGAMVGYLQDLFLDDALAGVIRVATGDSIAAVVVSNRNGETGAELAHHVTRPIPVSPFHLTQVWDRIDPDQVC